MEEKGILIIIILISILLLGTSFFLNTSNKLSYLENPDFGEGLGKLCDSKEDCQEFCQSSMGRCIQYCQEVPENELCNELFGGLK